MQLASCRRVAAIAGARGIRGIMLSRTRQSSRLATHVVGLLLLVGIVSTPTLAAAVPAQPASSPHEAVWEFLDRVHRRELDEAATYLALPRDLRDRGRDLAAKLGAV